MNFRRLLSEIRCLSPVCPRQDTPISRGMPKRLSTLSSSSCTAERWCILLLAFSRLNASLRWRECGVSNSCRSRVARLLHSRSPRFEESHSCCRPVWRCGIYPAIDPGRARRRLVANRNLLVRIDPHDGGILQSRYLDPGYWSIAIAPLRVALHQAIQRAAARASPTRFLRQVIRPEALHMTYVLPPHERPPAFSPAKLKKSLTISRKSKIFSPHFQSPTDIHPRIPEIAPPPAAPVNAPFSPSNNSGRSRRRPRARSAHRPARTRRPAVPNPLTPNYFARNWLRSANPLHYSGFSCVRYQNEWDGLLSTRFRHRRCSPRTQVKPVVPMLPRRFDAADHFDVIERFGQDVPGP